MFNYFAKIFSKNSQPASGKLSPLVYERRKSAIHPGAKRGRGALLLSGRAAVLLTDLLLMADVLHSLRQDGGDMVVIQ